ncbi:hypothetical protein [Burkholderia cepacia]|uniref:hypothetical protein n=1 Tax=Burkholderia cepacia TaxID=292 RepID=UPI000752F6FD|nr:hypothetical protein [Burkholderia cepacia]KVW89305.1 hypothetical protein WL00_11455 [Burkholderia cepacia]KVX72600.1 hypothetical protein WL07_13545 [Burkholderia cepacia]
MNDDPRARADRLLDLWSALALRHVALGSACACGAGGVSLRLEDFELDIVDYLQDSGERCELAEVATWFRGRQGVAAVGTQPLRQLLEDVQNARLPQSVSDWLIPRLERTLRSFAELHGSGTSD